MNAEAFDQLVAAGEPPLSGQATAPVTAIVKPKLTTISASELQAKSLPPLQFVVNDLLPHGLSLLCSLPKHGKSWMVLDLCLSVASGGKFLGHSTNQCDCLYLALEDGERRLQTRLNKLLDGETAPSACHFSTLTDTIDGGLFEKLEGFLELYPSAGLIVIDTFQKVRGTTSIKENAYAADYREMTSLKQFADCHNIALLLVHHLRKQRDDGDPYNMISGTNGIMGAADTIMVLTQDKRSDINTTLSFISRDVEDSETILTFDKFTCRWSVVGSVEDIAAERNRRTYETNPIVQTVKALLERNPTGWRGTMTELLTAGLEVTGHSLASGPRDLTAKLQALDDLLAVDGIAHTRIPHGTGGGKHQFQITPTAEDILSIPLPDIQF